MAAIDELKKQLDGKFSSEEIDKYIVAGKILAQKPLIRLICDNLKHCCTADVKKIAKLVIKFERLLEYQYCGYVKIEFNEIPETLHITWSIADNTYRPVIDIPDQKYGPEVLHSIGSLKTAAQSTFDSLKQQNPTLFAKAAAVCGRELSFTIDPANPMLAYIDPAVSTRMVIFGYYVDANGHALYRK